MSVQDSDSKDCSWILEGLSPQCGVLFIPIVAIILSDGLDIDQITVLSAFLTAVADSMAYIAAQMQLNDDSDSDSDTTVIPAIP
ncbi:hypothetical protein FRZ06_13320 [Anoxybacterium hadale]|uniref:Uncharacterized protein n=1 Tax=Anoxybacterium hadale TaxID=3408580 RepID=A0ACD1ACW8_9FIRM|nr:hypothetical protein FRZ06_13320 [Clostridiales bacterium]